MTDAAASGNLPPILVGLSLLALFLFMFRRSNRAAKVLAAPKRRVAYECVVTAARKADEELSNKFPGLGSLSSLDDIHLVRFGIFNWGELPLDSEHITEPISVIFENGSEVLSVEKGESFKMDAALPEPETPAVKGSRVIFPPFPMTARGTVIYNMMIQGKGRPSAIGGAVEGVPIDRLS